MNSQTVPADVSATTAASSNKTYKKLVLNLADKAPNVGGELKDELIAWKEKVISVSLDESAKHITIIHNQLLEETELFEVLAKYGLSRKFIISYN